MVSVTTPHPVSRVGAQTAFHRIAVNVCECRVELALGSHVPVVIPRLPKACPLNSPELSTHDLLKHLYDRGKRGAFGFMKKQVNVLGHHYVSVDREPVPDAHPLESLFEDSTRDRSPHERFSAIATERNGMDVTGLLNAMKSPGHGQTISQGLGFPKNLDRAQFHNGNSKLPHPIADSAIRVGHKNWSR